MGQIFGNKYVKGITQFIPNDNFGALDFIDYHCMELGISRDQYIQTYGVQESVVKESKESDSLAKEINKSMIKIDDSMSYEDFALAVGKILKEEYGSHNYKGFMETLHKDLGI